MKNTAEFYRIFFRIVQALAVIGLVVGLAVAYPLVMRRMEMQGGTHSPYWIIVPVLFFTIGQMLLAEAALRAVSRKRYWGVIVGLIFSGLMIPSWAFLVGVFGFYCFLNPKFQREYLVNAPAGLRDFMGALQFGRDDADPKPPI